MLSCREATRLVSESQDRRLGIQDRLSLRLHLAMCTACSEFDRQMGTLRTAMRRYARSDMAETPEKPDDE